jgi:hypothetical protein
MFKKLAIIFITTCALVHNVSAASDGELLLKKITPLMLKNVGRGSTELLSR